MADTKPCDPTAAHWSFIRRPGPSAKATLVNSWFCLLLFKSRYFRYFLPVERWLSGLKQWFAKPPYAVKVYRGFESPPLRHFNPLFCSSSLDGLHYNAASRGGRSLLPRLKWSAGRFYTRFLTKRAMRVMASLMSSSAVA